MIIDKIFNWLSESNRFKHLIGGVIIGLFAYDEYCAAYVGIGVAGAMEFKDWQWGGKPDWVDFALTVAGTAIGFGINRIVRGIFNF